MGNAVFTWLVEHILSFAPYIVAARQVRVTIALTSDLTVSFPHLCRVLVSRRTGIKFQSDLFDHEILAS
uniref:(California timema) hypothetical protein n=1 Tax=Timema californicum TaxID=61474 RepID=A0A7R9PE33_TIMCA|nr:unnamed protein product [Timema californicum]